MLARQSATNPSTNTSQTHSPRPSTCLSPFTKTLPTTVDPLYDKFAKYETRRKLAGLVAGKADKTTDDSLALFGQQASSSSSKKKGEKEGKGETTGKKGHIQRKCSDGEKNDEKRDEKEDNRDDKSKPAKGMRKRVAPSTIGDALHSSIPLSNTGELLNIDSGASDHFTPSRGDLGA